MQNFVTLLTPSYPAAVIWLGLLLFLDKQTTQYRRFWCGVICISAIAILSAAAYFANLPSYAQMQSGAAGAAAASRRPMIALALAGFPAFPIAFLTGCFPPLQWSRGARFLSGILTAILVLLAVGVIWRAMERYDHDRSVAITARMRVDLGVKEGQTIDERTREMEAWYKEAAPDPTTGPRTNGEWQYMGVQPTYQPNEPGGVLTELAIRTKPSKPDPYPWIAQATTVNSLYVFFALTPERLKTIASLRSLRVLHLNNVDLDDAGLEQLLALEQLEELAISGSQVTAAGLPTFLKFKSLKNFELSDSTATYRELGEFASQHEDKWRWTGNSFILRSSSASE